MAKSKEDVVQEFRVQSIQEAAIRVISRKGMASATMQEIAEEAGVAKGTIYLYFRDREELVEKTFETAMEKLFVQIDEALYVRPIISVRGWQPGYAYDLDLPIGRMDPRLTWYYLFTE